MKINFMVEVEIAEKILMQKKQIENKGKNVR